MKCHEWEKNISTKWNQTTNHIEGGFKTTINKYETYSQHFTTTKNKVTPISGKIIR